jgi:hypothetical protein
VAALSANGGAEEIHHGSTQLSLHPAYFNTRFRVADPTPVWPDSFVIITAYATTGEQWSDEENARADKALRRRLVELAGWVARVTGYDPATGHSEQGWAVEIDAATGVSLGQEFRQDAIYRVESDQLTVVSCTGKGVAGVGGFWERVDLPSTQAPAS